MIWVIIAEYAPVAYLNNYWESIKARNIRGTYAVRRWYEKYSLGLRLILLSLPFLLNKRSKSQISKKNQRRDNDQ